MLKRFVVMLSYQTNVERQLETVDNLQASCLAKSKNTTAEIQHESLNSRQTLWLAQMYHTTAEAIESVHYR